MKAKKRGIIHALAFCQNCNWTDGLDLTQKNAMQCLRNCIRSHVHSTKHIVILETGISTEYSDK